MKTIQSRDNPTFRHLKKLAESARERRKAGQALLDGVHLIESCLDARVTPSMLVVLEHATEHAEVKTLLQNTPGVACIVLPPALFAEISPVETPLGILAVIDIPHGATPERPQFAILLEDLQDPGNLGSILRSAAAAGVEVAYLSVGCVDAWAPKVLRAGMGAHFALSIVERSDLNLLVQTFDGLTLAACLQGDTLFNLDLKGPVAFMIGNEGAGLTAPLMEAAGRRFTIPMPGAVESLNAAAATAICLFERVRQTTK